MPNDENVMMQAGIKLISENRTCVTFTPAM